MRLNTVPKAMMARATTIEAISMPKPMYFNALYVFNLVDDFMVYLM